MDIITPVNAIQLGQAVVGNLLSRTFERVTGCIPATMLLSGQRAVLNQEAPGTVVPPAVPADRVIVPLFAHQVIAVVVIPGARRLMLSILLTTVDVMSPANAYQGLLCRVNNQKDQSLPTLQPFIF